MLFLTWNQLYPDLIDSWNANEIHPSGEITPLKETRYRIRFVTIHLGEGGGFEESETGKEKKKGNEKGKGDHLNFKLIIMATFIIL